jgi:hypothetical protein
MRQLTKSAVCGGLVAGLWRLCATRRYVTGNRRETLGKMEEEWGVLMFFLDSYKDDPERHKRTMEKLAIFGPMRNRRGAELKVMSAVEAKQPGQFTRGLREKESRSYWGTDTLMMSDTELAYGLGANGSTRRKLARSAGECVGVCVCTWRVCSLSRTQCQHQYGLSTPTRCHQLNPPPPFKRHTRLATVMHTVILSSLSSFCAL